ncbi:MAG: antibiotic biosynthesis monooxygenase [Alphaproteobacteria bacterium]|nr:antibiotic biosynthesis monooxygenase [Alphaproteobacteria bacterium]
MPSPYVVLVRFTARPDRLDDFAALLRAHAAASRKEPGCQVFDVTQNTEAPTTIVLYEVYDDTTAYAFHHNTPHYALFRKAVGALVEPGPDGAVFQVRRVLRAVE